MRIRPLLLIVIMAVLMCSCTTHQLVGPQVPDDPVMNVVAVTAVAGGALILGSLAFGTWYKLTSGASPPIDR